MLHFNDFRYYAVPSLPVDWQPPMWLRVELGIFSGRLYFEFAEYSSILGFLGVKEGSGIDEGEEDDDEDHTAVGEVDGTHESLEQTNEINLKKQPNVTVTFTRKPLAFLQEWLSIRRKGQDFAQTPMGFVCQGKPLLESHPFFSKPDQEKKQPGQVKRSRVPQISEEDGNDVDEEFCGDDAYGVEVGVDEPDNFDDNDLVTEEDDNASESD